MGCDSSPDRPEADGNQKLRLQHSSMAPTQAEFGEDDAQDVARDDLSSQTFQDVGDTSACTEDCSGHDAGFEWAKENGLTDASECQGSSQSFVEGCEAYAAAIDEQVETTKSDYQAEQE
jgi:hypothetical protein